MRTRGRGTLATTHSWARQRSRSRSTDALTALSSRSTLLVPTGRSRLRAGAVEVPSGRGSATFTLELARVRRSWAVVGAGSSGTAAFGAFSTIVPSGGGSIRPTHAALAATPVSIIGRCARPGTLARPLGHAPPLSPGGSPVRAGHGRPRSATDSRSRRRVPRCSSQRPPAARSTCGHPADHGRIAP